jgi:hypothetical protein
MKFYWLVLGILAVWRITYFINAEDGPGKMCVRLRAIAGAGFWGRVIACFYCLSLWVAAPFAILTGDGIGEIVCLWLAFSTGAILLERLMHAPAAALPAAYFEHEGQDDELLRKE